MAEYQNTENIRATATADKVQPRWFYHPCFLMVCLAFLFRLSLIWYTQSHILIAGNIPASAPERLENFNFGFETGAIAGSLASGHGFSSPFGGSTGPSAWIGPVYPGILALIFKIFGLYSVASCTAILTVNCLFSAITCIPMWYIGLRTVGRDAALIGGWLWTAGLSFMEWPVTWVWDMPLSALLLTSMFLFTLQLVEEETAWKWNVWGILCGIAALTNPALCTCVVISGTWLVWRRWKQKRPWLQRTLIATCLCIVVISPWLVRNRLVFGQWVFLRSNFGFELSLGNYQNSNGYGWVGKHPIANKHVFKKYKEMGELAFVEEKKHEAFGYIEEHPIDFLHLSAIRFWSFWDGTYLLYAYDDGTERIKLYWPWSLAMLIGLLAYWAQDRALALYFTLTVFLYPWPYYITYPQTRYRHAIEPILLLFCGYAISQLLQSSRQRISSRSQQ